MKNEEILKVLFLNISKYTHTRAHIHTHTVVFPQCRCAPKLRQPTRRELFISGIFGLNISDLQPEHMLTLEQPSGSHIPCAFLQDDGSTSRRERERELSSLEL